MGGVLWGDYYRFAAFWISSGSCWPVVQSETSETTDFNSIAFRHGFAEGAKKFSYRDFDIFVCETGESAGDGSNEFGFDHGNILASELTARFAQTGWAREILFLAEETLVAYRSSGNRRPLASPQ